MTIATSDERCRRYVYAFVLAAAAVMFVTSLLAGGRGEINLGPFLVPILLWAPRLWRRDPLVAYGMSHERFREVPAVRMLALGVGLTAVVIPLGFLVPGFVEFTRSAAAAPGQLSREAISSLSTPLVLVVAPFYTAAGTFLEEALFRGLIQGWLTRWGAWVAIVIQAVGFGLLHVVPAMAAADPSRSALIWLFSYTSAIGFVLGILRHHYRSLLAGWYVHWATNFSAVVLAALAPAYSW